MPNDAPSWIEHLESNLDAEWEQFQTDMDQSARRLRNGDLTEREYQVLVDSHCKVAGAAVHALLLEAIRETETYPWPEVGVDDAE